MAASCTLVTNPSSSGPTLVLHSTDSSNGISSSEGVFLKPGAKMNRSMLTGLHTDFIWLLLCTWLFMNFYCLTWVVSPSSDTQREAGCVWSSWKVDELRLTPLNAPCFLVLEMSSSLGLAVVLLCPFVGTECWCQHCLPSSSFPTLLHLCLYLSLLLKMLSPSPVPQGSSCWKNKAEGKRRGVEGWERSNRGKGGKAKGGREAPDLKAER